MKDNHEELLAKNPMLLARAFWHIARKYGEVADGVAPTLPVFLVSAGLLLHRETVEKIYRMNFESRFLKVAVERPDLLAGLQGRIEANAIHALRGLQLGVSSELLQRDGGEGFPSFRAIGSSDLPWPLRDPESLTNPIMSAAKRLGSWFGVEPLDSVQRQLIVEF